jgi:hypothetical protein
MRALRTDFIAVAAGQSDSSVKVVLRLFQLVVFTAIALASPARAATEIHR